MSVNVDGEALSASVLEYRVARRAVRILAPYAPGGGPAA
jgi:hypothetical protein